MANQQATDFELGWLAGIVDGEGWLGMTITQDLRGGKDTTRRRKVVKVELKITNLDEAIVEKSADIFQKIGVNPYRRSMKCHYVSRVVHECACKNMTNVERILIAIREHLTGNKSERAALILQFIELRRMNAGILNPNYAEPGASGRRGPRTIRPYSEEELALVTRCRELQSRGASQTTRETRDRQIEALQRVNAARREGAARKDIVEPSVKAEG